MNILVLIKRVVATDARIKVGGDGVSIDASGVQWIMAPYDEIAVEKALQLKTEAGAGEVTVLTVGEAAATKELRTALAMGADKALHVVTDARLDAAGTTATIKAALADRAFDLILCGKQATDEDDAAVGPRLAALLGMPCVSLVHEVSVADGKATCKREMDGETEVIEVDLPCVLTAQKGLAEARYPSLKGIMAAKKKPLETIEIEVAASPTQATALALPPERGAMVTIEPTPEGMQQLLGALRNDKKVL